MEFTALTAVQLLIVDGGEPGDEVAMPGDFPVGYLGRRKRRRARSKRARPSLIIVEPSFLQALRHPEMMLQRGQRLAGPILQVRFPIAAWT